MELSLVLYLEVNLIGMIFPITVLLYRRKSMGKQAADLAYVRVSLAVIFVLLTDMFWAVINGRSGEEFYIANYIVNIVYLVLSALTCGLWLQFVVSRLNRGEMGSPKKKYFIALPILLVIILSLASIWTGCMFHISDTNLYIRGPLMWLQRLVCYGYILVSVVYPAFRAIKAKTKESRSDAIALVSFVVLPVIGGIVNMWNYRLPAIWPLAAISMMMVYVSLQSNQISTDELTGLNNRRQYDKHMDRMTSYAEKEDQFCLMLLDVDKFKTINDTYGHAAGDQALIKTSSILKKVFGNQGCFIARFGGDEFAVTMTKKSQQEIHLLLDDLKMELDTFNQSNKGSYQLFMSAGIGQFVEGEDDARTLFNKADAALYKKKFDKENQ